MVGYAYYNNYYMKTDCAYDYINYCCDFNVRNAYGSFDYLNLFKS